MKDQAFHVVKTLSNNGHKAVYTGGCVRDPLIGKTPKDWDVATSAKPEEIKKLFPNALGVGESFGVMVVILDGHQIEVATFRKDGNYGDGRRPDTVELVSDLKLDASRRDFTMNALFYDPLKEEIIDFFGGVEDIKNKRIRAVGCPRTRIAEDKLRMLRAVRFNASLGFDLDHALSEAISSHAAEIVSVSSERIRSEIMRICGSSSPELGFQTMLDLNLMRSTLPEVADLVGCEQDPIHHPEGDVWTHSIGVVRTLKEEKASPLLILTGLLHDVGKCKCQQIGYDTDGLKRISNKGHDYVGGQMVEDLCKRLRFTNEETYKISELVRLHMKAHLGKEMKKATLTKFLRHLTERDIVEEQILLQYADGTNSAHKDKPLLAFYREQLSILKPEINSKCLLSGQDLIDELNLRPGPIFKRILDAVREAQDEGLIQTRPQALEYVLTGNWN